MSLPGRFGAHPLFLKACAGRIMRQRRHQERGTGGPPCRRGGSVAHVGREELAYSSSCGLHDAGRGVAGGSGGPRVCYEPGSPPSMASRWAARRMLLAAPTSHPQSQSAAPTLTSAPAPHPPAAQVSGDPKGFDLTGDGERWEAAGGDEISEAAEFSTVLYDKWVEVLGPAAESLEWEPAQVGGARASAWPWLADMRVLKRRSLPSHRTAPGPACPGSWSPLWPLHCISPCFAHALEP